MGPGLPIHFPINDEYLMKVFQVISNEVSHLPLDIYPLAESKLTKNRDALLR